MHVPDYMDSLKQHYQSSMDNRKIDKVDSSTIDNLRVNHRSLEDLVIDLLGNNEWQQ